MHVHVNISKIITFRQIVGKNIIYNDCYIKLEKNGKLSQTFGL